VRSAASVSVAGRTVNLSNLDKVLYPAADFTKADVIGYYSNIAPALLPHLEDRPLTLKRYPDGVDGEYFYEKRCPSHKPAWVNTAAMPSRREGQILYCLVDSPATLVWVANLASLEMHALLCRQQAPDRPTSMVFDLDPGEGVSILDCARVGLRLHEVLEHLGLQSCIKTSGGKGLHLWVPLNTPVTFERTKRFSHALALMLERETPALVTANMSRQRRAGRVFIDWSQNDAHKTTAVVYSLRATARPAVSTPIGWDELRRAVQKRSPAALAFDPEDVVQRFRKQGDVFAPVLELRQRLPSAPA
jgi:bifunctional non-homologous end joining protein LigD